VQDLSILPFPYPDLDAVIKQHKICYYECSRGCPFHCAYCLSGISHAVRRRPLALVLADLQRFMDAGVPLVKFVDRTYNLDEDYYVPILKFLAEAKTDTTFHLEIKADLLSEKVLAFLKTVPQGRLQMEIGVQSTNSATLKAVGRVNDWQELKHNVQLLLSFNNMHIHLDLIAGLPYEDLASYSKSFDDAYALRPQMLQLGFLKVLPVRLWNKMHKTYGLVYMEEPPYQVLRNKYLSYEDLAFLEIFTEVFDLTYNSGLFPRLLDYLVQLEAAGAFAFYKKLSLWWRQKGFLVKGIRQHIPQNYYMPFVQKFIRKNWYILRKSYVMMFYYTRKAFIRSGWGGTQMLIMNVLLLSGAMKRRYVSIFRNIPLVTGVCSRNVML
jgi:radical SAM superfamily enzyme YgiQ (UPF0313 family)